MADGRREITRREARQLAAALVVQLIRAGKVRLPDMIREEAREAVAVALGEIEAEMLDRVTGG